MAAVGLCQLCSASFSALGSFICVSDITGLVEDLVFTKKLLFRTRDQLQYSPAYTFNAYSWLSQWDPVRCRWKQRSSCTLADRPRLLSVDLPNTSTRTTCEDLCKQLQQKGCCWSATSGSIPHARSRCVKALSA